jgi:hypothetical protein
LTRRVRAQNAFHLKESLLRARLEIARSYTMRLRQHGTVTQAVCKQARRRSLVAVAGDTASRSNTHVLLKAPKWWTRAGKRGRLGSPSYLASHSFHPITSRRYGSEVHGKHLTLLSISPYLYPQPILGPRSAACPAQPCLLPFLNLPYL